MKNEILAVIVVLLVATSLGAGYLVGTSGQHTETFTQVNTYSTTLTATVTTTAENKATYTLTLGTPIPVESIETANISVGGSPRTIAVNPYDGRIYVEDYFSNILTVVDATSHSIVATIELPAGANNGIAVDSNSDTIYALVQGGIAEINGTSNKLVGELTLNFDPGSLAYNPNTRTIFGSLFEAGNESLIGADARTGSITMNIPLGYSPDSTTVNPQTDVVFVVGCNQEGLVCNSMVSVVNATSGKLLNQASLGNGGYPRVTMNPITDVAYVSGSAQLVALNGTTGKMIYDVNSMVCGVLDSMAVDLSSNQVLAMPLTYNYILAYDGASGALVNMFSFPSSPEYVAYNPSTSETYVTYSGQIVAFPNHVGSGHLNGVLLGSGQNCPLP